MQVLLYTKMVLNEKHEAFTSDTVGEINDKDPGMAFAVDNKEQTLGLTKVVMAAKPPCIATSAYGRSFLASIINRMFPRINRRIRSMHGTTNQTMHNARKPY